MCCTWRTLAAASSLAAAAVLSAANALGAAELPTVTIPAGTAVDLLLQTPLSSDTARAGDRFSAKTARPLRVGGRTALPAGTTVRGVVSLVLSLRDGARSGVLGLRLVGIEWPGGAGSQRISADLTGLRQDDRPPIGEEAEEAERVHAVLVGQTCAADGRARILVGDDLDQEYARTTLGGTDAVVEAGVLISVELDRPLTVRSLAAPTADEKTLATVPDY
jgi:hypothetical protein